MREVTLSPLNKLNKYKNYMAIKQIKLGTSTFDIDYSHCVQTTGDQTISGIKTITDYIWFQNDLSQIRYSDGGSFDDYINYLGVGSKTSAINSTDKLYLVGSSAQNDEVKTNSNSAVYMQSGAITASNFYKSSDERLKVFRNDLLPDFDKIKSIPKKYFEWKDKNKSGLQIGTSAQELQKVYPELVSEDENGMLSVDYASLSIVALSAIDKLHEEIELLKDKIKELENGRK